MQPRSYLAAIASAIIVLSVAAPSYAGPPPPPAKLVWRCDVEQTAVLVPGTPVKSKIKAVYTLSWCLSTGSMLGCSLEVPAPANSFGTATTTKFSQPYTMPANPAAMAAAIAAAHGQLNAAVGTWMTSNGYTKFVSKNPCFL